LRNDQIGDDAIGEGRRHAYFDGRDFALAMR
jgi:hypothetical protein